MSYTWQNGELITAEKLNQTGGGVFLVSVDTTASDYDPNDIHADKSFDEIAAAMARGENVIIRMKSESYDEDMNVTEAYSDFHPDSYSRKEENGVVLEGFDFYTFPSIDGGVEPGSSPKITYRHIVGTLYGKTILCITVSQRL